MKSTAQYYNRLKGYIAEKRAGISTLIKFGIVGASGIIVNNGMLWLLTHYGSPEAAASIFATETAIISNFIGNSIWTWKDHKEGSWKKRFLLFQGISIFAGAITVLLFLGFRRYTTLPLLVANTAAIAITFAINFTLNSKITWRNPNKNKDLEIKATKRNEMDKKKIHHATSSPIASAMNIKSKKGHFKAYMILFLIILLAMQATEPASALISVSSLGFHPLGIKTFTVYTNDTTANYSIVSSDGTMVKNGTLSAPTDYWGNPVECQGNNSCLTGDFSEISAPGIYHITTTLEINSTDFPINADIYRNNAPLFNEFFDAQSQQNSSYHADMNSATDPAFPMMADGSFIMTADQASLTLIRLGDAYRRNPTLLASDKKTFILPNTPDIVEHMILYANYLESLQDTKIQQHTDGTGFRINTGMTIAGAFTPGPTPGPANLTNLTIYDTSTSHLPIQSVPIISACGGLTGTAYNTCINDAASYYKCQIGEPCINLSYTAATGTRIKGQTDGLGVENGWTYEFGCYFDVNLQHGNFNDKPNPCLVYDATKNREQTVAALFAYTEAIAGINQYDQAKAQELLDRSVQTQQYIKASYPAFLTTDNDTGFWGAANFLLYDITHNVSYLDEAYNTSSLVDQTLISDSTRGNEFYWQEYILHKDNLTAEGYAYLVNGVDPAEVFRGKMYGDYKDKGAKSISATGEQVYEFNPNIQFQNSRYMLTEALFASKTRDLSPDNATLISTIADSQLSWLTGNNEVDLDPSYAVNLQSVSFIFGIGNFPTHFHSRLLMDTGYAQESNNTIIGMRGSGFMFFNGSDFIGLDGRTTILGNVLGSPGNSYNGETSAPVLNENQTFNNGKTYIPGWINGPFHLKSNPGTTFNYNDDSSVYEFTETTNEIVATAISLFAYRDAQYNDVAPLPMPYLIPSNTTNNNTNTTINETITFNTIPQGANITLDGTYLNTTPTTTQVTPGKHNITFTLTGYETLNTNFNATENTTTNTTYNLTQTNTTNNNTNTTINETITFNTIPQGANITLDGTYLNTTPTTTQVTPGKHNITFTLTGYETLNTNFNATENTTTNTTYNLTQTNTTNNNTNTTINETITFNTIPQGANITLDGTYLNTTPTTTQVTPGKHNITFTLTGYETLNTNFNATENTTTNTTYNLTQTNTTTNTTIINNTNTTNTTNITTLLFYKTNATIQNNSYTTFEMSPVSFTVQYDRNTQINWYVDGMLTQSSQSDRDTFSWTPDILYTSNMNTSVIKAVGDGTANATFYVNVVNYLNPFWQDTMGSPDAILHVFSNNHARNFTSMIAELEDTSIHNVTLSYEFLNSTETDWKIQLTNMAQGNTYIRKIYAFDNTTNSTEPYQQIPVLQDRAHYRQVIYSSNNDGGGGGAGSIITGNYNGYYGNGTFISSIDIYNKKYNISRNNNSTGPQYIYSIFSKDIIKEGESIVLQADARDDSGLNNVSAVLTDVNGVESIVHLSLIRGTRNYGTWDAIITNPTPGKHNIARMILSDDSSTNVISNISNSFYVIGNTVTSNENLDLIYTLLDKNIVNPGGFVTIKLDARDYLGITAVSAVLKSNDKTKPDITTSLSLVEGTSQYGTWESNVTLTQSDTTYALTNITLSNGQDLREINVYNQRVYVNYTQSDASSLTGMSVMSSAYEKVDLQNFAQQPTTPLIIGLTGMVIAMFIALSMTMKKE